jgi:methylmalonyl-CoA/ethylmalonyl-CoA epimerase
MTSDDIVAAQARDGFAAPGAVFDHVAHAAHTISSLLPLYQGVLGGRFYNGGDNVRIGYRAVQLVYPDGSRVELLEPLPDSDFLERFFARNPNGGLHHVTFMVGDLDAAIAASKERGFELVGEYRGNLEHEEVFVHPRSAAGTVVQFVGGYRSDPIPGRTLEGVLAGEFT